MALALASLLLAATLVACGGGGSVSETEISLKGDALRAFLASVLLTAGDLPQPPADAGDEQWFDDPAEVPTDALGGGSALAGRGWLGTLTRPFFVRDVSGRTFTLWNGAVAFDTTANASSWLSDVRAGYADELGLQLAGQNEGTSFDFEEIAVSAGEESWGFTLTGELALPDAPADLVSAFLFFRRGPIVAVVGMSGFVALDEPALQQLATALDGRIDTGLAGQT
jgi:hypothetical protein